MPYESILQKLNAIDPKSIKSIFLPSPSCSGIVVAVCNGCDMCAVSDFRQRFIESPTLILDTRNHQELAHIVLYITILGYR